MSKCDKSRENISFDGWQLCISLEWNITQSSVESVIKSKVACTFTLSLQRQCINGWYLVVWVVLCVCVLYPSVCWCIIWVLRRGGTTQDNSHWRLAARGVEHSEPLLLGQLPVPVLVRPGEDLPDLRLHLSSTRHQPSIIPPLFCTWRHPSWNHFGFQINSYLHSIQAIGVIWFL